MSLNKHHGCGKLGESPTAGSYWVDPKKALGLGSASGRVAETFRAVGGALFLLVSMGTWGSRPSSTFVTLDPKANGWNGNSALPILIMFSQESKRRFWVSLCGCLF